MTRFVSTLVILYGSAMLLLGWYLRAAGDLTPAGMLLAFAPRWALLVPWALLILLSWWRSKKVAVLAMIGAGATAFAVAGFELPTAGEPTGQHALRLVTYNTDGSRTLASRIRRDLSEWDADVIVFEDCPSMLADSLRKFRRDQVKVVNELCFVSRLPIRHFEPMAMPRWDDRRTRAARIDVEAPGGVVTVIGVHFPSPRTALTAARQRNFGLLRRSIEQRARISGEVRAWSAGTPHPVIVAGDFNMPQGSVLLRRDWGMWRNAFSERGWGFGHTMRVGPFAVRIDHVFVAPPLLPRRAHVLSGYPSEHQPVMVDIAWPQR